MSFLGSMFSSPTASNVNIPTQLPFMQTGPSNMLGYDPSQIAPTQANLLGGIGGLSQYNLGGMNLGQAQNIGQGMINDPNAASYVGGAMTASGLGQSAAINQFGAGGGLYGLGGQIANTAFDPQQALYARTLGQVTDQARANASAAGLGTTPVGLGATDWATNNFNIDWQNQQLQRQIAGGQAAGGLYGQASGMQAGAAPLFMQSAAYPYQASQQVGQNQLGTLNQLGQLGLQAAQIPGQQIAGYSGALGQMGNLQQQAFNQQQQQFQNATGQQQQQFADAAQIAQMQLLQNQQVWNQQQQQMGGIGKVLGGIGGFALGGLPGAAIGSSMFGGSSGTSGPGWGGQNFSGMNSTPFGGLQPQMSGFAPSFFGPSGTLGG